MIVVVVVVKVAEIQLGLVVAVVDVLIVGCAGVFPLIFVFHSNDLLRKAFSSAP